MELSPFESWLKKDRYYAFLWGCIAYALEANGGYYIVRDGYNSFIKQSGKVDHITICKEGRCAPEGMHKKSYFYAQEGKAYLFMMGVTRSPLPTQHCVTLSLQTFVEITLKRPFRIIQPNNPLYVECPRCNKFSIESNKSIHHRCLNCDFYWMICSHNKIIKSNKLDYGNKITCYCE